MGLGDGKSLGISIHALREESDMMVISLMLRSLYFNPRSP